MAYTVLARRYRSQSFGDVVGQEPIATTLKNAITSGRVAHAYLFSGTRGVGKTSMARIFARALNAPDTIDDAPKPDDGFDYPELDIQQRMAEAIMRGDDLNVIEIDGASHNSVQDARDLIGSAGLSPTTHARYKIYIIDEVHMLSNSAFNALLKTMEEPPSHVKFILCTTEPHKIPATIHSRCQRFDYKNIPTTQIKDHLAQVLASEDIPAEDEVIYQVAVLGNGSMRDALSLLDRIMAAGQTPLTVKLLEQLLGLPPRQQVIELIDAMAHGQIAKTLELTDALLGTGIGHEQLLEVLIERLRQLMLIAACGADSELVELSDEARAQAAGQAKQFDAPGLVHMIALCEGLSRSMKISANPRALLDATCVRLALSEKMADVTAVLAGAEKKKLTASPTPAAPPSAARPAQAPVPAQGVPAGAEVSRAAGDKPSGGGSGGSAPVVDLGDVQAIWQALYERVANISSFAWVDQIRLSSMDVDAGLCIVEPKTANRDIARSANTRQRERLASQLNEITGRRFRVDLALPAGGKQPLTDPESKAAPASATDRQAAMSLPLVRDILDTFPDAVLLDVRKDTASPKPSAD